MKREFIYFKSFEKKWHELDLTEGDLAELETMIMTNPQAGDMIKGTGGLRKLRFSLPNRGKSGSTRVLYVDFISCEKTILMNIFPKNEQENITDKQKQEFKKLIDILVKEYQRSWEHE